MLATFTSHCKLRLSLCSFTALSPHFLPISVFPFPFRIVLLFSLSPDSHSVRGSQSLWRSAGGSRVCDGSSAGQGGRRRSSTALCRAQHSAGTTRPLHPGCTNFTPFPKHTLIFIVLALQTRILTLLPCYAWSRTAQSLQSKKDEALLTYA